MEIIENECATRLQQSRRVRRGVVLPFAATTAIENQEIKRPVFFDQAPIAMEHGHIRQPGKKGLACSSPRGINFHTDEPRLQADGARHPGQTGAAPCSGFSNDSTRAATRQHLQQGAMLRQAAKNELHLIGERNGSRNQRRKVRLIGVERRFAKRGHSRKAEP